MTKSEYLKTAKGWEINLNLVAAIEKIYCVKLPELLRRIISHSEEPYFFDDGTHVLSYSEVLYADEDLDVAFSEKKLIPVVDCCDGNYVVYDYDNQTWAMYSIIDDILFNQSNTLDEIL